MAPRKKKSTPRIVQRSRQSFYGIKNGRIAVVAWFDATEQQVVSTANSDGSNARVSLHSKLADALKVARLWLSEGDKSC